VVNKARLAFVDTVSACVREAQEEVLEEVDDDDDDGSDHGMDPDDLVKQMMKKFPIIPEEI
jgi:hypothetical protein